MKYLFLSGFLFIFSLSHSQHVHDSRNSSDSTRRKIVAESVFESNSNSISNKMVRKLLWGGYMDQALISDVHNKLNERGNRFGFRFANHLYSQWTTGKHTWVAGLKYVEMFGLKFSKDFFGTGFLGNAFYEGKHADFSGTALGYWNYTGITFGTIKTINSNSEIYAGISALYGLNYQSVKMKSVSLYTAPDGEFLQVNGDVEIGYKEPGYGLGLGLNASYRYRKERNEFVAEIQDAGVMQFRDFAVFKGGSQATYRGENIGNFNNLGLDSLFSDFDSRQAAKRFNISEKKGSRYVLLPFTVHFTFTRTFSRGWSSSADIFYVYMPAYVPKGCVRVSKRLEKGFNLSAGLSYGGFGRQNFLLGIKKDFRRNWSLKAESYFLGIALAQEQASGFGLSGGISKGF